jgi:cytoskeleton protein RodZ
MKEGLFMNEGVDQLVVEPTSVAEPVYRPSAGALLKQSREAAGLHIAALAVALKVPVRRLEALEADRFDLLPDAVFARALAGSVCRALKMDAKPVLALLPDKEAPRLGYSNDSLRQVYTAPVSSPRLVMWRKPSRPAVLGGAGIVLCALALLILPPLDWGSSKADGGEVSSRAVPAFPLGSPIDSTGASTSALLPEPSRDVPQKQMSTAPSVALAVPTERPAALNANAAQTTATASMAAQPGPPTPALTATTAVLATVPSTDSAKAPTAGILVFKPTSESWVEVSDARGVVLLRRLLAGGEVAGVSGSLPLTALVGRADVTRVQVRGQALDLTPMTQNNVARFEVK